MTADQPLRILAVISHPWDRRLGAPRVYMELAEQWRGSGNTVEKFSLSDAYPNGAGSGAKFLIRQFLFARKAAAFIRQNRDRFDVVDALVGDLPFSKTQLGFRGLLVARSVGLPQFYDEFEQTIPRRWPGRSRGRLRGRIFYEWARRRRVRASQEALAHADLINVPNAAEAAHLRAHSHGPSVVVEPYGLTDQRLDELEKVAAACDARLTAKEVSFIGMWGPRKGAYDWPELIALIRAGVPEARFAFHGTMVEPGQIRTQLAGNADRTEFVSDYEPHELPSLLGTSTVGAFPSYVEGFGLAVLEQLAAGIPTVAFDVPGPRDILKDTLPELLVAPGDLSGFARAVTRILQLDPASYRRLAERSRRAVIDNSWRGIAADTLESYRSALRSLSAPSIVFAQPFGLSSPGGGARILRALLHDPLVMPTVVSTAPEAPVPKRSREIHIPRRPSFGRIEFSRWHALPELVTPLFRRSFRRRLRAACREHHAIALHAIPHRALDFFDSYRVAVALGLPYFLQVHDDLLYSAQGGVNLSVASSALKQVWSGAQLRFVISRQMGEEYCRRYGRQEFVIITDGIDRIAEEPVEPAENEVRIYFMGLFHIAYEENLRVLLRAIARARTVCPSVAFSVTLRCGQINARDIREAPNVRILPFGSEADVARDMEKADLVYLPLPFGTNFEPFVRLSLSTKLVTYLGSGIPILYHGPAVAAVAGLLTENDAALVQTSLDADALATQLTQFPKEPLLARQKAANALALARREFTLEAQRDRFWNAIGAFVSLDRPQDNLVVSRA